MGTGTSQGIPLIACHCAVCRSLDYRDKRLRTSIHLATASTSVVIDTGPDFRQQALRERIDQLDGVVFTHEHKDHIAGLDDVRAYNYSAKKDMPIYASGRVINRLKQEFAYAFAEHKYPGVPELEVHEIGLEPFRIGDIELQPIEVMHYKLPVLGFRSGDFTYITDAKTIEPGQLEKVRGSRVIVVNGLQQEPHLSHFTLDEAVALLEDLAPEKAYITHISHRMGRHREVEKHLPPFIQLAYDGLKFEV